MHQKGDGYKRHIFVDKMNAQQPVKISNLSVTATGTTFFNKGAGIQDLPSHTITFQYEVQDPFQVTMVSSLMKSTTGNLMYVAVLSGKKKRTSLQKRPPNSSVMQRLQIPVGLSRCLYGVNTLLLSKKETSTHSQNVNCATFMGSASTTKSTTVSAAKKKDLTKVKQQEIQNWICCPEILNVAVSQFLTCKNKDCKKKITSPPGSKIAKCLNCNRSTLIKNCYVDMTVSLNLEKDGKVISVTAFPKVVSGFLQEGIFNYKEDTDPLIEKLLLLDSVDFQLSQNGKLVAKMHDHEQGSDSSDNK